MSYATVAELKDKYSEVATSSGLSDESLAARLSAASAYINTKLSRRYGLPITPCQVLKDIEMDLAFAAIMFRPWQGGQVSDELNVAWQIRRDAQKLLQDLADGKMDLLDDDNTPVSAKQYKGISSNTKGLSPAFSVEEPLNWGEPEEPRR